MGTKRIYLKAGYYTPEDLTTAMNEALREGTPRPLLDGKRWSIAYDTRTHKFTWVERDLWAL